MVMVELSRCGCVYPLRKASLELHSTRLISVFSPMYDKLQGRPKGELERARGQTFVFVGDGENT